jgi:redox-sensitive bicupin YhaK (pirin superfamily)
MRKSIRVSRNVGLNPIAQAVFRDKFRKQMIASKIRVLSMQPGEPCIELLEEITFVLAVVGKAYEIERLTTPVSNPEAIAAFGIVRGGISAATQLAKHDKWEILQTVAMVKALEAAENLLLGLHPINISKATILLNHVAADFRHDEQALKN